MCASCKYVAGGALAACTAMAALLTIQQTSITPESYVRDYYNALPSYRDGSIVLDLVETVKGWDTAPEGFAIVRMSARRLGMGGPDRGQHELVIVDRLRGVIDTIVGFASLPVVSHAEGVLRVDNVPAIALATPEDVYSLAAGEGAGAWVIKSGPADYAMTSTEILMAAYVRIGRAGVHGTKVVDLLGPNCGSTHAISCVGSNWQNIHIDENLPATITTYTIEPPMMSSINEPNFYTSKIWECEVRVTITDTENKDHQVGVIVVGDPSDRDLVIQIIVDSRSF